MSAIAVGVGVAGIAANMYSSNQALQAQKDAAKAAQVDIDALNTQTKAIATQNAIDSANLEKQLTPQVPQIRNAAYNGILGGIAQTPQEIQSISLLQNAIANGGNMPLLQAAIAKAQSDLNLGGKLDAETQNAVTRSGIANAGSVGGVNGGIGLGRDVVARDLGLTSLQLEQQRLATALGAGGQEQSMQGTRLQQIEALNQLAQNPFSRAMAAGQFGESIKQPVVGLDPTAIANLKVGNSNSQAASLANQANIYGKTGQNIATGIGQIGGGLLAYNVTKQPTMYQPTSSYLGSGYSPQPASFAGK